MFVLCDLLIGLPTLPCLPSSVCSTHLLLILPNQSMLLKLKIKVSNRALQTLYEPFPKVPECISRPISLAQPSPCDFLNQSHAFILVPKHCPSCSLYLECFPPVTCAPHLFGSAQMSLHK